MISHSAMVYCYVLLANFYCKGMRTNQYKYNKSGISHLFLFCMCLFFKIKGGKRIMFFFCFFKQCYIIFYFCWWTFCEHWREKKSVNVFICCNDIYLSKNFATGSLAKSAICFWKKIKVVHQIIIHLVHKI